MIQSAQELKEYCLRRLGAPVINIELEETQMQDRINDAIDFFIRYHYDGSFETWYPYTITKADVSRGYFDLSGTNIIEVIEIYDPNLNGDSSAEELERINFRLAGSDQLDLILSNKGGLSGFELGMQTVEKIKNYFTPNRYFEYNRITGKLKISAELNEGRMFFIRCYEGVDPETSDLIYNDEWIKKYTTALFKMQWGENIKKYDGIQMAGGVTLNGKVIYDEAKEDVMRLEDEFQSRYETPPGFFVG